MTWGSSWKGAGWPWLWHDSWGRLLAYWGTGVGRASIHVQYFGRVYLDRDVPWHYPWFYFLATVPVGLHAIGIVGLVRGWRERRGDGFPLLLVHGWPETKRIWIRNVQPLAEAGFEVIVPDLRGFGDSGLAPDGHYDAPGTNESSNSSID